VSRPSTDGRSRSATATSALPSRARQQAHLIRHRTPTVREGILARTTLRFWIIFDGATLFSTDLSMSAGVFTRNDEKAKRSKWGWVLRPAPDAHVRLSECCLSHLSRPRYFQSNLDRQGGDTGPHYATIPDHFRWSGMCDRNVSLQFPQGQTDFSREIFSTLTCASPPVEKKLTPRLLAEGKTRSANVVSPSPSKTSTPDQST
jgi:hypothetical protein